MARPLLVARYSCAADYLAAHRAEVLRGGLLVRGASLPAGTPLGDCTLRIEVEDEAVDCPARLGGATPGMGVLVLLPGPPQELVALASRLDGGAGAAPGSAAALGASARASAPADGSSVLTDGGASEVLEVLSEDASASTDAEDAPEDEDEQSSPDDEMVIDESVFEGMDPGDPGDSPEVRAERRQQRVAAWRARQQQTLPDKMRLAMVGDRDARFALLRDPSKQLHPLVLKNPRIGLEEVLAAAKLVTLNPDALKLIADHPEWSKNGQVAAALVRNPKTPMRAALRALQRVPFAEVRAIAKSQIRPQLVMAARRQLTEQK
jgi:hypothetical protein